MSNALTKLSKTCCYDNHGYYIFEDGIWSFLAKEKQYSSNDLLDIINTLHILNET